MWANIVGANYRRANDRLRAMPDTRVNTWNDLFPWMKLDSPRPIDPALIRTKRILITGAGGSVGSALAHEVASLDPDVLVALEASEQGLFRLTQGLRSPHTAVLGSVGDEGLVRELFETHRFDLVLHAAAYKHVPLLESQPFAAIANNALATRNLVRLAAEAGTSTLVLLSTDKAVEPVNMLGVSKRIAELATLDAGFTVVRLGNILGSAGSVLPLLQEQLDRGEPLTVTHSEASRYFLTMPDAVQLLLLAATEVRGPQLFVPEMGDPILIRDLAERMLASSNRSPRGILYTGLRAGEKLHEVLIASDEKVQILPGSPLRAVITPQPDSHVLGATLDALTSAVQSRNLSQLLDAIHLLVPAYQGQPEVRA
ncbi:MAG: polysaccharide biosynthesis protein [Silvibacterium sp.]